jgi:spore photoproduct lyase
MTCWEYYSRTISTILWHPDGLIRPVRERTERLIAEHHLDIESRDLAADGIVPPELEDPRTIVVSPGRRTDFGPCPGTHGHCCCNYLTLDLYAGCTLGCTYCIMQSYLRNRTLQVLVPDEGQIKRIRTTVRSLPQRKVRIGTGEVGDSLLYDPLFGVTDRLITALGGEANLQFEVKTKTDYVDHLPRMDSNAAGANVAEMIVGFSLNPPELIAREEGWAAPLDRRLAAAKRALQGGYHLSFHFDPLILHQDWRESYAAVVERLAAFRDAPVAWISLGTLRYPPTLRSMIEDRPYALEEFISAADGKMRYLQPVRSGMYRFMKDLLTRTLPRAPVYLCMESAPVWRNFMLHSPDSAPPKADRLRSIMRPFPFPMPEQKGGPLR